MNYAQARREARKLYGDRADVESLKSGMPFPCRIVVRANGRAVYIGVGNTWEEAFADVKVRLEKP